MENNNTNHSQSMFLGLRGLTMIWDLDGTILDSYEVIVATLYKTYKEYGIELDKNYILRAVWI